MATIKLRIDKRRQKNDGTYPVIIYVSHRGKSERLPTGVSARETEWNSVDGLFFPTNNHKGDNVKLRYMLSVAEACLFSIETSGELNVMTIAALKYKLMTELNMTSKSTAYLVGYLEKAKEGKAERTQALFTWAQTRVNEFDAQVKVSDINEVWISKFRDSLLKRYSPNTVAQAMAWVSRALSLALTEGVITRNPALAVRRPRADTRKKSLPLDKIRELRDMVFEGPQAKSMEFARDIWFLQFYLLGINVADLWELKDIINGRIEYSRHKTGTFYSVKVQPEALAIIEKWRGSGSLISHRGYKSAGGMCSCLTRWLKMIMPGLSTNYARHSWASVAAELDIPIETISHALGHKIGSPITAIYVAYSQKKVDDANRRVIDYINEDLAE